MLVEGYMEYYEKIREPVAVGFDYLRRSQ